MDAEGVEGRRCRLEQEGITYLQGARETDCNLCSRLLPNCQAPHGSWDSSEQVAKC